MATITTINASDLISDSRAVINTNFANLNTDKAEKSLTVNSKALSTNPVLTTADVADSTDKRYVTDAQRTVLGNTSGTNTGDVVKATGAEINTGSNDDKFATPKAIADSTVVKGPSSSTGDHLALFDGTSGKLLKDGGVVPASVYKCGIITRAFDGASGAVTTAHGCGAIPKYVRFTTYLAKAAATPPALSVGVYNGTTTATVYVKFNSNGGVLTSGNDTTNAVSMIYGANDTDSQKAVATFDATNITLTWTHAGTTTTGDFYILWEAYA